MFFIQLTIGGKPMYLHNTRLALHLPDYAHRFPTETAALRYMKRQQDRPHVPWRIVEIPDAELAARRFWIPFYITPRS